MKKLARQHSTRLDLQRVLTAEIRQLSRTASYVSRVNQIQDIRDLLIQSNQDERQRFYQYLERILNTVEVIPLTADIIREGERNERQYTLRPQDAIVYASVMTHLRKNNVAESCFLNRNSRDFNASTVLDELTQYNCRMIPLFDQGYHFIYTRVT